VQKEIARTKLGVVWVFMFLLALLMTTDKYTPTTVKTLICTHMASRAHYIRKKWFSLLYPPEMDGKKRRKLQHFDRIEK